MAKKKKNLRGRPVDETAHDAIVDAATALFLKNGFAGTSMDDVARKANIAKLTVYNRFPGKEALFKAIIMRKCSDYNVPKDLSPLAHLPVRDALTEFGKNFVSLLLSPEALQLHRVIEIEVLRNPKISKLFYEAGPQTVGSAVEALFATWEREGKISVSDIPAARDHFLSMLKGERHCAALMGIDMQTTKADIAEHVRSCVDVFLAAYGAK